MKNGKFIQKIIGRGNFPRLLKEYNKFLLSNGKNTVTEATFYSRFNANNLETVNFFEKFVHQLELEKQLAAQKKQEMFNQL